MMYDTIRYDLARGSRIGSRRDHNVRGELYQGTEDAYRGVP